MEPFIYNNPLIKPLRRTLRKNQTDAEKKLWSRLRNKHLCGLKFYRQYGVGRYILDFFCPAIKLAIELDGGQHAEEKQVVYDKERSLFLAKQDIRVIRFWNNEVLKDIDHIMEIIWLEINKRS